MSTSAELYNLKYKDIRDSEDIDSDKVLYWKNKRELFQFLRDHASFLSRDDKAAIDTYTVSKAQLYDMLVALDKIRTEYLNLMGKQIEKAERSAFSLKEEYYASLQHIEYEQLEEALTKTPHPEIQAKYASAFTALLDKKEDDYDESRRYTPYELFIEYEWELYNDLYAKLLKNLADFKDKDIMHLRILY